MKKLGIVLEWWWFGIVAAIASAQSGSPAAVVQATLTEPGSTPFYLQAAITERGDPNEHVEVEMSWVAPNKWRRTIQSSEFSQTLIVNGDNIFEEDSDDYFPLGIQTLVTAMVDSRPVLDTVRRGDRVMTQANGSADETGKMCFGSNAQMCAKSRYGLAETVGAPGHSVDFMDYQKFKGKSVARLLIYRIDPGDSLQARVLTLGELTKYDEDRFSISNPTPLQKQIRSMVVPETELRNLALQPTEIIWPQVLEDNQTTGETSYYVSLDRSGQVREILPLSVAIERADDSARRQIMKWKFKPVVRDGIPMQAEAVLNFHFNTRAYGPVSPLTDTEVRKLASNIVEPVYPAGAAPGSTFTIRVAVDADGNVIESMAGEGAHELYLPCSHAIGKWHFSPIFEDGKPRPYRAQITCRVP
ncbi:MAG TPA: hypothetical protein VGZ91_01365 [Candidatus Sulfotelmatobacter sp.]|jgi:hypothetical protein|nr:hypothetical protein [Candidatus Sulfotelmatobacter sp.]